jgi:hypothetical protein
LEKGTILIALYASPRWPPRILDLSGEANQACSALVVKKETVTYFYFNSLFYTRGRLQQIAVGAAQHNISSSW